MIKPPLFDKWNPAMRGAYRKGYECALARGNERDCPYKDRRTPSGRLSWSRAFIRAWLDGFRDGSKSANITEYYKDRAEGGLAALAK